MLPEFAVTVVKVASKSERRDGRRSSRVFLEDTRASRSFEWEVRFGNFLCDEPTLPQAISIRKRLGFLRHGNQALSERRRLNLWPMNASSAHASTETFRNGIAAPAHGPSWSLEQRTRHLRKTFAISSRTTAASTTTRTSDPACLLRSKVRGLSRMHHA